MNERYFILSPMYSLRGWKLLPYAIQHLYRPNTEFFRSTEWELLRACDGQTVVDWDKLSDDDRKWYERWEQRGYIVPCEKGTKLRPEQEYRFFPARFKENVQWSITGKCNYKCRHCFMSAPHAAQGEPSFDQLMTMLSAFERCGIKGIQLTGGEPLVRHDFWELVDEILRRGMVVPVIYTNGQLVTDSFLDELDKRHMRPSIQFSFDGTGSHDWLRGVDGAEKAVIAALRRCKERRINTAASMVLFKENRDTIRESVNLLAELGCSGVKICNASPQGEWESQTEHYLTQAEVYEAFLEYIPHFFEDGKPVSLGLEGFFSYEKSTDTIGAFNERNIPEERFCKELICGHARREMYVSPKGNVLPCMAMVGCDMEEKFPNMLETPLEDILNSRSLYMDIVDLRVSDLMEHDSECRECSYRTDCCGGCRAVSVRDHPADYLAKDLAACEYFKGGWRDKKYALLRSIGVIK